MDSNKLRRLAGIPIDLSKLANAKATVRTPARLLAEAAKVPAHRGELAPKTKDNMRARVNHAKKALEALELARDELMDLPAVDYMEDIPTVIKQLHQILHGEDGTGGIHHLHRKYKNDFDTTTFPEDVEEEKRKSEEEAQAQEAGITGDEADTSKKKKTNECVGLVPQKKDPAKENKKPFKLAPDSLPNEDTMVMDKKAAKEVGEDPAENTKTDDKVVEDIDPKAKEAAKEADIAKKELAKNPFGEKKKVKSEEEEKTEDKDDANEEDCAMTEAAKAKKPKWLEKAEVKAEEKEGKKVSAKEKAKVNEASGPLFARDAEHPKHDSEENYSSWTQGKKPVNVVSAEDGPSLYYPDGSKRENANQLSTNPYNESQKANVPAKIKTQLKEEADKARKLAETFTMRKDWDSKNFHETLANAMDTLNQFLEKGTIYGIKEAQVFMTSLMSPFTNKLPADVIKFVASGGSLRSLKSYVNDVKEPHTGTVFQQDSDGTK
jgi:hypothetical protein